MNWESPLFSKIGAPKGWILLTVDVMLKCVNAPRSKLVVSIKNPSAGFALMMIGFASSPAPGTKVRACALALRASASAKAS